MSSSTVVSGSPGYNSWPMCQTMGKKIVCAWSRGMAHDIFEPGRAVFARVSPDGGQTWEEETQVCNTPGRGDVTVGKGLDEEGNMLLWVRHSGPDGFRHRLYRSCDGKRFVCIAEPELPLDLVQITDIFHLPGVGLTALFFGGTYGRDDSHYWGKLTSTDNGATWRATVIEEHLPRSQWPTEPSAVSLGEGLILAVARTEVTEDSCEKAQFQLTSTDGGRSWCKAKTNITDVMISTPSLIHDRETDLVSCYYYYRGKGLLNRRIADAREIFDAPLNWSEPETVASGSCEVCEAGNVNAVSSPMGHVLSWYSGKMPSTAVYVKIVAPPRRHQGTI